MRKLASLAAAGVLAGGVAGATLAPASASAHRVTTHRACRLRDRAYRASGTLSAWNLTQNSNGTWSGTVTLDVLRGNAHANGQIGTSTTYTLTDARVRFGPHASDPPAADSRIQVLGRALVTGKRCTGTGKAVTDTYAINRVRVHAPAPAGS